MSYLNNDWDLKYSSNFVTNIEQSIGSSGSLQYNGDIFGNKCKNNFGTRSFG